MIHGILAWPLAKEGLQRSNCLRGICFGEFDMLVKRYTRHVRGRSDSQLMIGGVNYQRAIMLHPITEELKTRRKHSRSCRYGRNRANRRFKPRQRSDCERGRKYQG